MLEQFRQEQPAGSSEKTQWKAKRGKDKWVLARHRVLLQMLVGNKAGHPWFGLEISCHFILNSGKPRH